MFILSYKSNKFRKVLPILKMGNEVNNKKIKLSLSESFEIESFVNQYQNQPDIKGVYALESNEGKVQFIGSSENIIEHINLMTSTYPELKENIKNIRIQTFSLYLHDAVEAYKNELIKLTNPAKFIEILNEKSSLSSTNDVKESKLESLKEAVNRNIASSSINSKSSRIVDFQIVTSPFEVIKTSLSSLSSSSEIPSPSTEVIKLATCENTLDFTIENVNKVLDEVRPYLQSVSNCY